MISPEARGVFSFAYKLALRTELLYVCISSAVYSNCCGDKVHVCCFTRSVVSLLRRGFKDFLVPSYANALDDKHFSSNAGDAIRGRGETKCRENESEKSLCQISHDICTKGTISVPSVETGQGDGRA